MQKHTVDHPFSFVKGLMRFLGWEQRHLDEARTLIQGRSDAEALKHDWVKVAGDIRRSMEKFDMEYKREPHACE